MHIPQCETNDIKIISFEEALENEKDGSFEYDRGKWLYVPNAYTEYRYILGTRGENPLVCIGINPSTAKPDDLDNTLKSVERTARFNGYDSFIMFNVYPKRDTVFKNLEECVNDAEHIKNRETILSILEKHTELNIWAAFGNHIYDRDYLPICLKDIYSKLGWLSSPRL
jgi:hypothetical protein